MRRMSLPGAQARSTCSSTQVQRCCLPTAAPHLRPLQIRQRLAAQPRNLYSNAPLGMQHQPFSRGLACSASSGENGSDGSEKGRGGNGIADGSSPTSLRISTSSNPLPVPEPMPPSTRIEADLGDGEFDAFKEVSREYRRTYFDFEKWKSHRASSRYRRHIVGLFGSRIVRALGSPLLFVVVAAVCTGVYETSRDSGILPAWLPSVAVGASGAASLSGFALSLLLASRTTNSYGRWLEAANLVGAVGAASTNFVRQAYAWIPDGDVSEDDAEDAEEEGGTDDETRRRQNRRKKRRQPSGRQIKAAAARWAAVLPRALASRVREDVDLASEAARVLDPREAAALAAAPDAPRFVLAALSAIAAAAPAASVSVFSGSVSGKSAVESGKEASRFTRSSSMASGSSRVTADSGFRISMDDGLTAANSAVAGCERLLRLPIPLSYTRHTSRVLVIALAFLPATLWSDCGWACVPASALVAFLLLGIEEIGVAIEEPFSILPLENMWADVDSEIRALAAASGAVSSIMLSWEFDKEEEGVEEEGGEGREGAERALAAGGAAR